VFQKDTFSEGVGNIFDVLSKHGFSPRGNRFLCAAHSLKQAQLAVGAMQVRATPETTTHDGKMGTSQF
jgi:hypothetical protein